MTTNLLTLARPVGGDATLARPNSGPRVQEEKVAICYAEPTAQDADRVTTNGSAPVVNESGKDATQDQLTADAITQDLLQALFSVNQRLPEQKIDILVAQFQQQLAADVVANVDSAPVSNGTSPLTSVKQAKAGAQHGPLASGQSADVQSKGESLAKDADIATVTNWLKGIERPTVEDLKSAIQRIFEGRSGSRDAAPTVNLATLSILPTADSVNPQPQLSTAAMPTPVPGVKSNPEGIDINMVADVDQALFSTLAQDVVSVNAGNSTDPAVRPSDTPQLETPVIAGYAGRRPLIFVDPVPVHADRAPQVTPDILIDPNSVNDVDVPVTQFARPRFSGQANDSTDLTSDVANKNASKAVTPIQGNPERAAQDITPADPDQELTMKFAAQESAKGPLASAESSNNSSMSGFAGSRAQGTDVLWSANSLAGEEEGQEFDISSVEINDVRPVEVGAKIDSVEKTSVIQNRPLTGREVKETVETIANSMVRDLAEARRSNITIHLQPEDLGSVLISVQRQGRQLLAEVSASQENVKESLNRHRNDLVTTVERQGFSLTDLSIKHEASMQWNSGQQGQAEEQKSFRSEFERAQNLSGIVDRRAPQSSRVSGYKSASDGIDLAA